VHTDLLKDGAISRLFIARAVKSDSGNYTCGMRNAQTSITVHILNGERRRDPLFVLSSHVRPQRRERQGRCLSEPPGERARRERPSELVNLALAASFALGLGTRWSDARARPFSPLFTEHFSLEGDTRKALQTLTSPFVLVVPSPEFKRGYRICGAL